MRARLLHTDAGRRTFALVFDKGEDPIALLTAFAGEEDLTGSSFTGIGAFRRTTLGYFDADARDYLRTAVDEQCEVLSLLGDIAVADDSDQRSVHAHVVLGKRDLAAVGGHLFGAEVWPTLELVLTEEPAHLHKRHDPDTGLALLRP